MQDHVQDTKKEAQPSQEPDFTGSFTKTHNLSSKKGGILRGLRTYCRVFVTRPEFLTSLLCQDCLDVNRCYINPFIQRPRNTRIGKLVELEDGDREDAPGRLGRKQ